MRLLGKDISADALLATVAERLKARGLDMARSGGAAPPAEGVEPRVDPLSYNLAALERNVDPTRPLPLETHRAGLGRAVVYAKWLFRKTCQVFINETLARQRVFNGHVYDAYAQVSAEVLRLRERLDALEARSPASAPSAKDTAVKRRKPTSARQGR